MPTNKATNIDEYFAGFPKSTQKALEEVRTTIKKVVPNAEETISYAIPCFKMNGKYLIYFAGYKNHIGIYPVPTTNEKLNREMSAYKTSGKGALQLPLNKPIPVKLITKIVKLRLKEN